MLMLIATIIKLMKIKIFLIKQKSLNMKLILKDILKKEKKKKINFIKFLIILIKKNQKIINKTKIIKLIIKVFKIEKKVIVIFQN